MFRPISLALAISLSAAGALSPAHAEPAPTAHPIKSFLLRTQNRMLRARFERDVVRANKQTARAITALGRADVTLNKAPRFGLRETMADKLIDTAEKERALLRSSPQTPRTVARLGKLDSQLAEYRAMPTTGPRTTAFVLVGQDQIYTRLDRKATPAQMANTLGHEMVHIRDLPKTTALSKLAGNSPADDERYRAFLSDGETRAYGEGSRIGGRLGESPFGIGQPITDPNARDRVAVVRSISDGYVDGVRQALLDARPFDRFSPAERVHREALVESYLAGYRAELPTVLDARKAWKLANPPPVGLVAVTKDRVRTAAHAVGRFLALVGLRLRPPTDDKAAFEAGRRDVQHDLHPASRVRLLTL